jgi:hypothetical protein
LRTTDDISGFVQKWRFALRKREPKNPERINGLKEVEQVAHRGSLSEPPALISTVGNQIASISDARFCVNLHVGRG